ncbi:MAG: hypothetical protein LBU32_06415 [Clostridiales bacterium]|nr:hypothetical protein [Clostridiales bacterium]
MPTAKIVVEAASSDIQKIKIRIYPESAASKEISLNFGTRGNTSYSAKGMYAMAERIARNPILRVHLIESRNMGGDAQLAIEAIGMPLLWASGCLFRHHAGKLKLSLKGGQPYRDAAFMGRHEAGLRQHAEGDISKRWHDTWIYRKKHENQKQLGKGSPRKTRDAPAAIRHLRHWMQSACRKPQPPTAQGGHQQRLKEKAEPNSKACIWISAVRSAVRQGANAGWTQRLHFWKAPKRKLRCADAGRISAGISYRKLKPLAG